MVVPSIDHGNSVPDAHVGGLFRTCQSSPTPAAYLSLYTIPIHVHVAKYLFFSSFWWKGTVILLAPRTWSSHFLNLDKRVLSLLPACVFESFKLELFLDGYAHPKFIPYQILSHKN